MPMSSSGAEVRKAVRQPLTARKPSVTTISFWRHTARMKVATCPRRRLRTCTASVARRPARTLPDNLLPDPAASGRLRRIGVGISGSVYHPLETPQLIEESFEQLMDTAAAIREPFE